MLKVLKRPDFRLLFIGTAASTIGDSLMFLVLAIWVKDLTGSSSAAGLTISFLSVPFLLAPLSGWFVDRVKHRPFLIIANIGNAVVLLPLAFVSGPQDVWLIYLVAVLLGIGATLDGPALNGLLTKLLPEELLVDANGARQTVSQGIRLIGPLAGAGLYLLGGGFVVAIVEGASFLIAAGAIALLKLREEKPKPSELHWRAELVAGFSFLRGDAPLRRAVIGLLLGASALGALESVAFALNDIGLNQPPEFISIIVTVMGAGGLIGGLLASRVIKRIGELAAEAASLALLAVTFVIWIVPSVPSVLAAAPLAGFALPILMVADSTLVQRRSPAKLIGRVSSASELCYSVPNLASLALGALLVSLVDYRVILAGMTVIMASAALYLALGRRLTTPVPAEPSAVPAG